MKTLQQQTDARGVTTITLNRPELHNAFDEQMIAELSAALSAAGKDDNVRIVSLRANGKSFSAGADLNWMQRVAAFSEGDNLKDAMQLARLMQILNELPVPVVGVVQGAVFGGGVGLVACCDIAIASNTSVFCLSEVKLGLIPAVISPYVIAAIGARASRRYMLSAEKFTAAEALRLGLIHCVVVDDKIEQQLDSSIESLLCGGPLAQSAAKKLIAEIDSNTTDEVIIQHTADAIAKIRASAEGREGLAAFLDKRKPGWMNKP